MFRHHDVSKNWCFVLAFDFSYIFHVIITFPLSISLLLASTFTTAGFLSYRPDPAQPARRLPHERRRRPRPGAAQELPEVPPPERALLLRDPRRCSSQRSQLHVDNCQMLQFLQNFVIFRRARSRLYQNEILQENMRSTAFFRLYKICILLHRCNLNLFKQKIGLKISK